MTNAELLDLLREARESVRDLLAGYEAKTLKAKFVETERELLARIDAALAERQDSAKDGVESDDGWEDIDIGIDFGWMDGAFDGHTTKLGPWTLSTFATGRNEWLSAVAFTEPFATEAEAKSAAIAAARGMK